MFMRFIAMAVLLLATSLCGAQDVNAPVVEPPIIIDSDTNRYDLRTGVTRFSDNVTIQRGAMRVSADEGVVHQSDGRIALVELFGSPTTWRDRLDDGSIVEGQAAQIQFEVIENVVTLIGDARLQHQRGRFTGDELIYDLDTESLVGRGSSGNQARVILEGDSIRRERAESSPESEPESEPNPEPAAEDETSSATATEAAGGAASRSSSEFRVRVRVRVRVRIRCRGRRTGSCDSVRSGQRRRTAGRTAGSPLMLRAEHLVKRYRGRAVVHDVSLEVRRGEVVGLLGPNGAGKTTCFYMVVGLVPADGGKILVDDHELTRANMHRRARAGLGYLPQEASIFRRLSVQDNIEAILELRKDLDREKRKQELGRLLDEFNVAHLADQMGVSLSGGERRRVEIARALAADPRFILLDEPFAGVDPISVGEIQHIVGHLRDREIGILITDHNVRETLGICDRAYIISEGRVLTQGPPDAVLADEEVRNVYLGREFRL